MQLYRLFSVLGLALVLVPLAAAQEAELAEAKAKAKKAMELVNQSNPREALPLVQSAFETRQRLLGEEHPDTVLARNNLAFVLQRLGDLAGARTHMEQVVRVCRKLYGENDRRTAVPLGNLGYQLYAQGDYLAARPYQEQALRILRATGGEDHSDTITAVNNLGFLAQAQGDYNTARTYLEQVLASRRRTKGEEDADTAMAMNNLGFLVEIQGDISAARQYVERALAIHRRVKGEEHPNTAVMLNNLGSTYEREGNYTAARDYFEQSLKIRKKVLGEAHPDTATALNNLGWVTLQQADFATARITLEQALAIRKKVLGASHPDTAITLNSLGLVSVREGDLEAARAYYEQSYRARQQVFGDDHPTTGVALNSLTRLEARLENWDAAAATAERTRRSSRQHISRSLSGLSEQEQLKFLAGNEASHLYNVLSLAVANPAHERLVAQAAGWLLNGKGLAHESLAARTLLVRNAANSKAADKLPALLQLRARLASLTLSAPKVGQEAAHKELLAKLNAEEQALGRELVVGGAQGPANVDWVTIETLRQAIPPDSVFIDIALIKIFNFQAKGKEPSWQPAHYVAWVIPAAGQGKIDMIDLGLADKIDSTIEKVRRRIAEAARPESLLAREGEAAAEKELEQDLARAAELVWKPLAKHVNGAKHVILGPDGALWLMPWAALPVSEEKCFAEQFSLRYVVSGRDLCVLPAMDTTTASPALFADPDYDLSPQATLAAVRAVLPNVKPSVRAPGAAPSSTTVPKVHRLPNTAVEAAAAAPSLKQFTGKEAVAYTGPYALESIAKRLQRPRALLFATHGFFLPDQQVNTEETFLAGGAGRSALPTAKGVAIENPLLRCGLLFTGCNQPQATGDDGVLTGMEIVGIDLRGTELVILSACETGVGKVNNGEGVAGLRQAFQLAGAKSVVSTLWQIPDRDSALIINDFFGNLAAGQTKAEALRTAQLKRIAERREKYGAAHPFYWAAWTVTGN